MSRSAGPGNSTVACSPLPFASHSSVPLPAVPGLTSRRCSANRARVPWLRRRGRAVARDGACTIERRRVPVTPKLRRGFDEARRDARAVSSPRQAGRRRNGRSVSRARHEARARRCAEDSAGRYYLRTCYLYFDGLTRLSDAAWFDTVDAEIKVIEGTRVRVATPAAFYRLKKATVRRRRHSVR